MYRSYMLIPNLKTLTYCSYSYSDILNSLRFLILYVTYCDIYA